MNEVKLTRFKELFDTFKQTEEYAERVEQSAIAPVFSAIIKETLKNEALRNEHLTGFIQMFKYGCTNETFDYYLKQNVKDPSKRQSLSDWAYEVYKFGYTAQGKTGITKPSVGQLNKIRNFLLSALEVKKVDEAISLCKEFDAQNIPEIKKGVYSPWLYYINPVLFPIINDTHHEFRTWLEIPDDYPTCIQRYTQLKELVGETEFGNIDSFAHTFQLKDAKQNIEEFIRQIHEHFKFVWRCASSNNWDFFIDNDCISLGWLNPTINYSLVPDLKNHDGKRSLERWVGSFDKGHLIILLDRNYFYGVAVSLGRYEYQKQDKTDTSGRIWPTVPVSFLYKLEEPYKHSLKIKNKQPATFYELEGMGFVEKDVLKFIESSHPEALDAIRKFMFNPKGQIYTNCMKINLNTILYGPPGTGKTFNSISYAVAFVENKEPVEVIREAESNRQQVKARYDKYLDEGLVCFTTFHQSLSYEDFIEGIKPQPPDKSKQLLYDIEDGIFKEICSRAENNWHGQQKNNKEVGFDELFEALKDEWAENMDMKFSMKREGKEFTIIGFSNKSIYFRKSSGSISHSLSINTLKEIYYGHRLAWVKGVGVYYPGLVEKLQELAKLNVTAKEEAKNYVLIIDEINRGNVSGIFGELITLLEEDKRLGAPESLKITLPYSKDSFGVPPNLFLIGTMNTADRSVEALDTALRRRFHFVEMKPDTTKIKVVLEGLNLASLLQNINRRLEILKDADHTIGHAWLWDISNLDQLKHVFANKIIPLLKEYFYNDYEKMGLVLGDNFFEQMEQVNTGIFASFNAGTEIAGQYSDTWVYQLKDPYKLKLEDFMSLMPKTKANNPDEL